MSRLAATLNGYLLAILMSASSFSLLPLSADMLANLDRLGYASMTPIQAQSLPLILAGHDLIGQASTGSGKTAAFGIGALHGLNPTLFSPQTLVMCPTRELADQVAQEFRRLARFAGNIKVLTLCGGVSIRPQADSLAHGAHVVVGTPGRISDHIARGSLRLDRIRTLVLDEADRMLDMGFVDEIYAIAASCPDRRQTLLFSATYDDSIRKVSARLLRDPAEVRVESHHKLDTIDQRFYEIAPDQRQAAVATLLNHFRPTSTLAFCNTKARCDELAHYLRQEGFSALALHGDLEQRDRDAIYVQFANQSCSVLVATDVAARGLDIKGLPAVINVDLTPDPEVHVHRIGRTGRNGETGLALSLCTPRDMRRANQIETYQKSPLVWHDLGSLAPAAREPLVAPMVTISVLGGKKNKLRPGDILGALTGVGGLQGDQVGRIHVFDFISYVALDRHIADAALQRLDGANIKGRPLRARLFGDDAE